MKEENPKKKTALAEQAQEKPVLKESSTSTNVKDEISLLKKKLNELNEEKEKWYAKREELSKTIKSKIGTIKQSATTRNTLTASVKEKKTLRRELNKKITDKIKEVKSLQEKQQKDPGPARVEEKSHHYRSKHREERKETPESLKRQIAALERKIEIEGLSFDKEKKVMKQIKSLKKQYNIVKETQKSWTKIRDLSKEINVLKKEADFIHKGVQKVAGVSQEEHKELIETSKNIDNLKKEEREAHNKFITLKKEFVIYNDKLKALVPEMKRMKFKKDQQQKQKRDKKEEADKRTLAEKAKQVEEKLKSGKMIKLTMEDLLAFQAKKE